MDENFGLIKNLAGGQTFALGHFFKNGVIVTSPTLAAGDVLIMGDYGNPVNITTLPTAVGTSTRQYKQFITQAESNYDILIIEYVDQTSPSEWDPFTAVIAFGTYCNSDIVTPSAATIADAVWDEALAAHLAAGSTGEALNDTCCTLGTGATTHVYFVTDAITGFPLQGVVVQVSTDLPGVNVIASGTTDALGQITFYLDAGTYYMWSYKSGYNFTNPDTEVVP